ncbi:MAG: hypothetical protein AB7I37_26250 [Pirellulales bacterium]
MNSRELASDVEALRSHLQSQYVWTKFFSAPNSVGVEALLFAHGCTLRHQVLVCWVGRTAIELEQEKMHALLHCAHVVQAMAKARGESLGH